MNTILIDTDVILDLLFDRQPFADDATKILALCEEGKLKGFVTPVAISNTYYLLRKTASHDKVIEHLKMLLAIVDIALMTKETVMAALNSSFKDFEDALQNYSAESDIEISVIVTRNIKDYKLSNLAVMTPEEFLKMVVWGFLNSVGPGWIFLMLF